MEINGMADENGVKSQIGVPEKMCLKDKSA